ncbi:dynamin family protein [Planctopirus hydrillae]|uniref:Dynamin N-terminal domain-containing protein n=1 Tax=Planctopirus hydrillae TaxID=1841610 RepID=A0A1C3E7F1_9PLAN|nr:dynamin family protein [Planctopirus hydrillae]ODA29178.1 hypothetical protein A6X21_09600 [Planctopirus hydrillae]
MDMTGEQQSSALLNWAQDVEKTVRARSSVAADEVVAARLGAAENRFVITVLGKAKRGKSTLINALLGRRDDDLAPVDRLPASNVISRFRYGDELSCRIHFRSADLNSAEGTPVRPAQVRDYVTEEGNPGNRKQVELLDVAGPFDGFNQDLVLVDTPGSGSIHEYHDALLQAFIPQSDAVIFLVTSRMPLDQDELDLLRRVRDADIRKILFVINKIDETTPEELAQAEAHNAAHLARLDLKQPVGSLIPISAKQAFLGNLQTSGMTVLAERIRTLITQEKSHVLRERLIGRVRQAVDPLLAGLVAETVMLSSDPEERARQRASLESSLQRLELERPVTEQQFRSRWVNAVDQFAADVNEIRGQAQMRVLEFIDGHTLASITGLSRKLPGQIQNILDELLKAPVAELERTLKQSAEALQSDYPRVRLKPGGVVLTRSNQMAIQALGWGGAAAMGATATGIITAAQAATAAAVTYVATPSLAGVALTHLIGTHAGFLTTTAVPAAIPFWVAAAGPIGWTLAGVGALAVPFAWTISRSRHKEHLRKEAITQVQALCSAIVEERAPLLRRSADTIVAEFQQRSLNEVLELRQAIGAAETSTVTPAHLEQTSQLVEELQRLLENVPGDAA